MKQEGIGKIKGAEEVEERGCEGGELGTKEEMSERIKGR